MMATMAEEIAEEMWRAYDAMDKAYADHAEDGLYNAHYDRPCVLELCGDVAGRRVVDMCCGPGLYMVELIARGATVIGFDASPPCCELARARRRLDGRGDGSPAGGTAADRR